MANGREQRPLSTITKGDKVMGLNNEEATVECVVRTKGLKQPILLVRLEDGLRHRRTPNSKHTPGVNLSHLDPTKTPGTTHPHRMHSPVHLGAAWICGF
eukprot:7534668-Heterocapsa_arctica.AAC.1